MIRMRPVAMVLVAVSLSGCGLLKKKLLARKYSPVPKEAGAQKQDVFIGVVESVNPEQKFVLIRMEVRMAISPGTRLETRPINGAGATLMVTPEHKLSFVSADITTGLPQRGDLVVMPPPAAGAVSSPPTTANAMPLGLPHEADLPLPQANPTGVALPIPGVPPDSLPPPIR